MVRRRCGQSGMSLMEVLVTLAVVLVLIGSLIGIGSFVKTRAQIDQTKGLLETLCTALERYYEDQVPNAFPIVTEKDIDVPPDGNVEPYDQLHLEFDLQGTVAGGVMLPEHASNDPLVNISSASSAALFWFLDKYPSSRAIVENIANTLVTNKADNGVDDIQIDIGGTVYDLPRYIDPWGTSLRYVYLDGTAFPTLTSAGPDKVFDTPDDITSK